MGRLPVRYPFVSPVPRGSCHAVHSVTMGIRNMAWNEWVELDQNFVAHHRLREHRIRHRGERVVKVNEPQPGVVAGGHDAGA